MTKAKPIPNLSESDIARFWKWVNKSPGLGPNGDCWEWTGATNGGKKATHQYGRFMIRTGKCKQAGRLAHRVSFLIAIGFDDCSRCVCHRCDNPKCVNPEHLFIATHRENMRDMVQKGRSPKIPSVRKLSDTEIIEVRRLAASGVPYQKIAPKFGVCRSAIGRVAIGVSFRGAGGPLRKKRNMKKRGDPIRGERVLEFLSLRKKGETRQQIATKLGLSITAVTRANAILGCPMAHRFTPSELQIILQRNIEGKCYACIAHEFGWGDQKVYGTLSNFTRKIKELSLALCQRCREGKAITPGDHKHILNWNLNGKCYRCIAKKLGILETKVVSFLGKAIRRNKHRGSVALCEKCRSKRQ